MTREELEKEIADWWRIKFRVELKDDICQRLIIDEVVELCNKIAEPREKRIAELEKERDKYKARCEHYERCIMQMREENEN